MSRIAWRASSAEIFSLPKVALIAISASETELNSRTFPGFLKTAAARLLRRRGDSTAKINTAVSRSRRKSLGPAKQIFHFLVCHRLPPIWIEDLNPSAQGSQHRFFPGWLLRAHDVHDRDTPAADRYGLTLFRRLDQFRQLILGIGYADLHDLMIAI